MAKIELTPGVAEIPTNVRVMRSKDGSRGSAVFIFEDPVTDMFEVPGMFMIDEEGELVTRDVRAKFADGKFAAIEAVYTIPSPEDWERFLRFMERFAEANEMGMEGE
ncbi:MAG: photosystem II reaction center protein Psb28 [Synechococcus sp.]